MATLPFDKRHMRDTQTENETVVIDMVQRIVTGARGDWVPGIYVGDAAGEAELRGLTK